jgi:hypothetical protein
VRSALWTAVLQPEANNDDDEVFMDHSLPEDTHQPLSNGTRPCTNSSILVAFKLLNNVTCF